MWRFPKEISLAGRYKEAMIFKRRPKAIKLQSLEELDDLADSGKPVFLDFWQTGCQPCRVMDGIVDELAGEFDGSAHVVKVDVRSVPGAAEKFRIRSTPTFVVLAKPSAKKKKQQQKHAGSRPMQERWRASGLVKKDQLQQVLTRNGAEPSA